MNLKKLNLGLVALLLGFGLVITQSAFTSKSEQRNFQYGQLADGSWVEIDNDLYECVESERICKGTFSSPNPSPEAMPDVVDDYGTYQLIQTP